MEALVSNISGSGNMAMGVSALRTNTTGNSNAAVGTAALYYNTTGDNNIGVASFAGFNLTTGSNNIEIGNRGVSGESQVIGIGEPGNQQATFIAGIYGATVPTGSQVVINAAGRLGTVQSSARYKQDIRPMDEASEAVLRLNHVTFRYRKEVDPERIAQFGLIAEEVAKVNPALVLPDKEGNHTPSGMKR
jgi:endosialidase-like protein